MKRLGQNLFLLLMLFTFAEFGCGGISNNVPPPIAGSVPMTITVSDTPPAGITLLSFEVTVSSATLNPGPVALIAAPAKIEVKQLETESAFLATVNVPAGTYQNLSLTFSSAELTFMNQTGSPIGTCQNNTVCEIESSASSNVTFLGSPFPLTITANTPGGLQLDLNVANIISNTLAINFSAANAVVVTQLSTAPAGELEDMDDIEGMVQGLDVANQKFTLTTFKGSFVINTDVNTEFKIEGCAANNFTCIQNGQVLEADVRINPGGMFVAKRIELEDATEDDELEGVVFKIDDATHFEMVVLDELRTVNNVNVGNPTIVTLSTPSFQVKADGLSVPSALQNAFQGATDTSQLLPGQVVQVRANSVNAGPPITVSSNRVRLRFTQLTANLLGAPVPPNFTLGTLPPLFTNAGITSIHVQTSSDTHLEGVIALNGLLNGDTVSVRGLLFKNGINPPELIAKKVRKR
jgi:hypothetical protein